MRKSRMTTSRAGARLLAACTLVALLTPVRAAAFYEGSLIIPMDQTYQDYGMLQAYGLVHQLLLHGIPVYRILDPEFSAATLVVYDDAELLPAGELIPSFNYRGGPFVIDEFTAREARPLIDAWNNPELWQENPWAERPVFGVVTIHQTRHDTDPWDFMRLTVAPRPAILADSREAEYARILRAAGVVQSDGAPFEDAPCAPGACGPGTSRPDFFAPKDFLLQRNSCYYNSHYEESLAVAASPLLDGNGRPRYALLAAAGWTVAGREAVECEEGVLCTSTYNYNLNYVCFDPPLVIHGHRILSYLQAFKFVYGSLFFMGEAAYALENADGDLAPPVYDVALPGHLLTGLAVQTACPCVTPDLVCVPDGCNDNTIPYSRVDCCLAADPVARNAGLIPGGTGDGTVRISDPDRPELLIDGEFHPTPGALGLFQTHTPGGLEPGLYGARITDGTAVAVLSDRGVTELGDFRPSVDLPVSAHPDTVVARLFLNALFASRWTDAYDDEALNARLAADNLCFRPNATLSHIVTLTIEPGARGRIPQGELRLRIPEGVTLEGCTGSPEKTPLELTWTLNDVDERYSVLCRATYSVEGIYGFELDLRYRDSLLEPSNFRTEYLDIRYSNDSDGDGVFDCEEGNPEGPTACGDADGDGYDDCTGEWVEDCVDCGSVKRTNDGFPCAAAAGRRVHPRAGIFALLMLLGLLALRRSKRT